MCGIAGILYNTPCIPDSDLLTVWRKRLHHRGPDDTGYLTFSPQGVEYGRQWPDTARQMEVVFLHQRLAIIDISENGWQPMGTRDGRYHIVYNGEIYNYLELRTELEHLGHQFHTQSDTEVLLAAFAQWQTASFNKLIGMFAIALLDSHTRRVFLVRDFCGIKPLYYSRVGSGIVFASEIKILLEHPDVQRAVNPERLYFYLRYGVTDQDNETLVKDLYQVASAHYIEIPLDHMDRLEPVRYWQPEIYTRDDLSFDEASDQLRDHFLDSVRIHLRSDVPVGVALSGGIDSSAITLAMRHLHGESLDIHTFSYVTDDPAISEEKWIDIAAQASGADTHKIYAREDGLVDDLDDLIYLQDEPFGSTSIYAQYRVFQRVREVGIKVMLDGQGADEILGGYRYNMAARLASLIRQGKWIQAIQFLHQASKWPGAEKLWLGIRSMDFLMPNSAQKCLREIVGRNLMPHWMNADWFAERGVAPATVHYTSKKEVLKANLYETMTDSILPHLLRYEDRNSMAFSIESRVPFLTPQLVEFMFSMPEEYIIAPDGSSKAIFRKAMRGIVPDAILDRRDKVGFATPEKTWLTTMGNWTSRTLKDESANAISAINLDGMNREWDQIRQGKVYFDSRVWRWLNLIHWVKQFGITF